MAGSVLSFLQTAASNTLSFLNRDIAQPIEKNVEGIVKTVTGVEDSPLDNTVKGVTDFLPEAAGVISGNQDLVDSSVAARQSDFSKANKGLAESIQNMMKNPGQLVGEGEPVNLNELSAGAGAIDGATVSKLAGTADEASVINQLKDKLGEPLANKIAPAVASAKDPNIVKNIIDQALNEHLPEPTPSPATRFTEEQPPAPSPPLIQDIKPQTPFLNAPDQPRTISDTMAATATDKTRGLVESIKEAPSISPEVKAEINSTYTPGNNKTQLTNSGTLLDKGLDVATSQVDKALAKPTGSLTAQESVDAQMVAHAHDVMGNAEKATEIYERLAEHATQGGQLSQSLSLLASRTPDGLRYWVTKTLSKAGVEITGDVRDQLNAAFDVLRKTPEDTTAYKYAVGHIQNIVGGSLPASLTDKAFSVWRAGLLTGPQTVAKIVTSHAVMSGAENVAQVAGSAVDKFLSLFTGQRSLVASAKGYGEGFKEGAEAGKNLIKTGVDINPGANTQEMRNTINFGNSVPAKFLNAYTNGIGNIHGAIYKPFFGAAHLESLYNQALAAAKTAGLKGVEADGFIANFVHSPSPEALGVAEHDAQMATFQQTTKLGNVASAIQKKGGVIGKVIAPFTKIPSAVATDLINYTPVGGMRAIVDGIKAARSEEGLTVAAQRELSQGLGRSIVGTAAIIPGVMLYNKGMLTLGYPSDPKEQQLWADEGKQPDSVLIGGQWRKLGSLGPLGSVLSIGGYMGDSLVQGQDMGTAILNGFAGGLKSIESQSYLAGVSGAVDAINNPGSKMGNFVKQTAGSVVPTIVNTVANATDDTQRQTTGNNTGESALNAIKSRIPGLRETLAPKTDAFGNDLKSGETGLERIIDPFQSSTNATPGPLLQELRRLENAGYGTMPTAVTKKENFGTARQPLNATLTREQMTELTKAIGGSVQAQWSQIVANPSYNDLSDDQKQAILKAAYTSIAQQAKYEFARKYQIGPFSADVMKTLQDSKVKRKQVI